MRETWVFRNGELILKSQAQALEVKRNGPMVISDAMDEMWSPVDGKRYTSKSKYRAEIRARGLTEVGNERQRDTRTPFAGSARDDVARAVEMVKSGYKPHSF